MKTLRLTRVESTAYASGERRFWREVKPMPRDPLAPWPTVSSCICWDDFIEHPAYYIGCGYCPYGTPGDRIRLSIPNQPFSDAVVEHDLAAITVEQRDGKWGWLVEVGA